MTARFLFFLASCMLVCNPFYAQAAEPVKIGVVDMQLALNETKEGRQILSKMKKKLQKENDILKKKGEELKKMQEDLKQQSFMLSEAARAEKEEKLRKLNREFERYREDKRAEFLNQQRKATEKIYKGLIVVLKEYAEKEEFTVIFEAGQQAPGVPGTIVYRNEAIDITRKIIELYDKKTGSDL